jgi:hypothetical protein
MRQWVDFENNFTDGFILVQGSLWNYGRYLSHRLTHTSSKLVKDNVERFIIVN